ncbi:phage holin family protein [Candidatus Gottesmanbacteria bacterium]|nr:phage holin family protein [Candidatus Gottesmanbacteria bacterium]
MKFILKKYLLAIASIFILTQLVSSFSLSGSWQGFFYAAFIWLLLQYIVKPILNIIMLPINLITLNMSSWIIQIAIFYMWTIITPQVKISDWHFSGIHIGPITLSSLNLVKWQITILLAILSVLINKLLGWVFK